MLFGDGKRPKWMAEGACRAPGVDRSAFFKSDRRSERQAKAVCSDCPVREPCAAFACDTRAAGIWGGMSELDRKVKRRFSSR